MSVVSSLTECKITEIPIIIPAFNNPTYVRNMLVQLFSLGLRNTIVIDNGSTAPEMQRSFLLAEMVVRLSDNLGPRYIFVEEREFDALPTLFCITDPDLKFNPQLPNNFLSNLVDLTEEFQIGKVGFSLDISDQTNMRDDIFRNGETLCKIWEWEQQFWTDQVGSTLSGDPIYRAPIDTTFAVYNKKYFRRENHYSALRLAGRYTCKHLPWYLFNSVPEHEAAYYASTQKYSVYHSGSQGSAYDARCLTK
jgi:hypothetical protein